MFTLIHGNDIFHSDIKLKETILNYQKTDPQTSISKYDYREISSISELNFDDSPDFFSTKRLFVLKSVHNSKNILLQTKTLNHINERSNLDIIFFETDTVAVSTELYRVIKKQQSSKIFLHELPRWDNQKQEITLKFIQKELKKLQIEYEENLPFYLRNLLGDDFYHILNEINKVKYIQVKDKLTIIQCKEYFTGNKEAIIFSLVNRIFNKNLDIKEFLNEMSLHLSEPNNFMIIISLLNRELRTKREKFTAIELKLLYNTLLDIDIDYKSGGDPKSLLLKFYINLHCPKYDYKWKKF